MSKTYTSLRPLVTGIHAKRKVSSARGGTDDRLLRGGEAALSSGTRSSMVEAVSPRPTAWSGGDDLDKGPTGVPSRLEHGQLGPLDRA